MCTTGYTCDVSAGTCTRSNTAIQEINNMLIGSVQCDDGSECPTGTTCCKLSSGQWGCCPYPNAVCCNDGEHCCPQGSTNFKRQGFNVNLKCHRVAFSGPLFYIII